MTSRGIFSLVFEFFLLIMALGTDIREFLIVAVCVGGLLLYSLISLLLAVFSMDFKSHTDETEVSRGEELCYTLSFRGPVILPVVGKVKIKPADNGDITDKADLQHSFLLIPSFKLRRDYNFNLLCAHTGYWSVGVEKLRISDMFGMFNLPLLRTRRRDFAVRVAVLPKIHDFEERDSYIDISKGFGGAAFQNAESGELLGDSRFYREGDALRRINWKQSARLKKLFTRRYETPDVPKAVIALDTACSNDGTGTVTDMYVETAVSIANFFVSVWGDTVSVVTLRESHRYAPSEFYCREAADLMPLKYHLMSIPFFTESAPLDLFRLDDTALNGADKIYVITANPSEGLLSAVESAAAQGKTAVCIIPQMGDTPLPDVEKAVANTGAEPIYVKSADEIAQKVGEAL